jgi:hypothetical protein
VENFPDNGMMGLFSFFTENGKGSLAMLGKNTLVYEVKVVASFLEHSLSRTNHSFSLSTLYSDKKLWSVKLGSILIPHSDRVAFFMKIIV